MGKLMLLIVIAIAIGFWLIKRSAGKAQASGYTRDSIATADTPETRATTLAAASSVVLVSSPSIPLWT